MNCDEAFDAMTDPSPSSAVDLNRHLADCPRCRALKTVLEPALSLLRGALPAEPVGPSRPDFDSPNKSASRRSTGPFLSAEAVQLAEAIAARCASKARPIGAHRVGAFRRGRAIGAALQSAALILFGALAVYCVGPWGRDSGSHFVPDATPPTDPQKSCTRLDLQPARTSVGDPRRVVLSCAACHLKEDPPSTRPAATSLLRRSKRANGRIIAANCEPGAAWPSTGGNNRNA